MGDDRICNWAVEFRRPIDENRYEWVQLPGIGARSHGLAPRERCEERLTDIYHGQWRDLLRKAGLETTVDVRWLVKALERKLGVVS